jgi:hypothetical protein
MRRGPPPRLDRAAKPGLAGLSADRAWQAVVPPPRAIFAHTQQLVGRFEVRHCAAILNCFSIILNSKNYFKLPKFVETCRSVQKLQNKFVWTPLEALFTLDLTKLTFMQ